MVIEVVVNDNDIKAVDAGKGEPDVTVNGKKLRMVQALDGNWYGYFADRIQAQTADQTVVGNAAGQGLDFGQFCGRTDGPEVLGFSVTETVGIAIPTPVDGGTNGDTTIIDGQCTGLGALNDLRTNNVVRENKTVNPGIFNVPIGQIGFTDQNTKGQAWPFVQLYNFNPTGNVVVQYNKGGGVQSTTLKFDTSDQFARLQLDRSSYPRNSQIHVTITDVQLNIDPTDEDSWTFQTNYTNATTSYQVFNEDGSQDGDGIFGGVIDLSASLSSLMFEDNGRLLLNVDSQSSGTNIIAIKDTADNQVTYTPTTSTLAQDARTAGSGTSGRNTVNTLPVTITEIGSNSGIFGTFDDGDVSTLQMTSNAPRGKSATIEYNETPLTILAAFNFGTVDIQRTDSEWNSGEEIPVMITDADANKNTKQDEDLDLYDPRVELIPSLRIGDPFTLGENGFEMPNTIQANTFTTFNYDAQNSILTFGGSPGNSAHTVTKVDKFSSRALIVGKPSQIGVNSLLIDTNVPTSELFESIHDTRSNATNRLHGFNFFNYDIRSLNPPVGPALVDVYLVQFFPPSDLLILSEPPPDPYENTPIRAIKIADNVGSQGMINLNSSGIVTSLFGMNSVDKVGMAFTFNPINEPDTTMPIVADFMSFGYINDGAISSDRINNSIYRIEAEETGDNTGVFAGTLEFLMLNQLNILDAQTYNGITTIADDPVFIVHRDLDDEAAPRVSYNDLGADGVVTQVADQEDAPTHYSTTLFDRPTYYNGETVIVIVNDQDLNTDVDLIDIYTTVNKTGDPADSTVGRSGLPILSTELPLGNLFEIEFENIPWKDTSNVCSTILRTGGIETSLFETGFTLIEEGSAAGTFTGDFIVPTKICRPTDASPVSTAGMDLKSTYNDYIDGVGQSASVSDVALLQTNEIAPPGYYNDPVNGRAVTICPIGTYQPLSGKTSCISASPGNFVATTGSTTQTQCLAGSYQPSSGQSSCILASPGFFVPNAGATSQTQCPDGTTSQAGATQCIPTTITLTADTDSFIHSSKNTNEGANTILMVQASGSKRSLVSFNLTGQEGKQVEKAILQLNAIYNGANWGKTNDRTISIFSLTAPWTEGNGANFVPPGLNPAFAPTKTKGSGQGVTWSCATDANIANNKADCQIKWNGATFAATPTDTITITSSTLGWIELDVTNDVQSILDGTSPNNGWIIKKTSEKNTGRIAFASSESSNSTLQPQLVIKFVN